MTIDNEDVPDFLKRTPEMQQRIDDWNAAHPPTSCSFTDPRVEANKEQRELERKEAARERIAKMKARLAAKDGKPVKEDTAGKEWRNGRWITPGLISRADADRILRELPSERHRKIFIERYGDKIKGKAAA